MAKNRFFTQGLNAPLLASPVPLASATPVFMHIKTLTDFASVFSWDLCDLNGQS